MGSALFMVGSPGDLAAFQRADDTAGAVRGCCKQHGKQFGDGIRRLELVRSDSVGLNRLGSAVLLRFEDPEWRALCAACESRALQVSVQMLKVAGSRRPQGSRPFVTRVCQQVYSARLEALDTTVYLMVY